MRKIIIVCTVFFILAGCQSNKENEVINNHNDFTNAERLDSFVENIKNGNEDEIVYTEYGIEGQKGQATLTYNGNITEFTYHSDGKFIEKFDCENFVSEPKKDFTTYTLKDCTGMPPDYELVVVPK